MNEKSFESRRVRTQPCTWMPSIGAVLASASLTEISPDIPELWRTMPTSTSKRQRQVYSEFAIERDSALACALAHAWTKRLLLWDIDGTLINTGAAGSRAHRATIERFGGDGDLDGVEIAGRTDTSIAHQILKKYGEPITDENVDAFLDRLCRLLPEELPRRKGRSCRGFSSCWSAWRTSRTSRSGLLTGNLKRGAQLKLEHYDLWRFFAFGAFADDHHDRNALGPFAGRARSSMPASIFSRTGRRHRRHRPRHRLRQSLRRAHDRSRDRLLVAGTAGRARSPIFSLTICRRWTR